MKMKLLALAIAMVLLPYAAWAHPHIIVELILEFVTDENGIVGVNQEWMLSTNYSARLISTFDADEDGVFSPTESAALYIEAFENLHKHYFFSHIEIDGIPYVSDTIQEYQVDMVAGRVRHRFFMPLHLAGTKGRALRFAVYDDTGYVSFALRYCYDPNDRGPFSYDTTIHIDDTNFCVAQDSGQRIVEIIWLAGCDTAPAPSAFLVREDLAPEPPPVNADPFLRDPTYFSRYFPENPFLTPQPR